MIKSAYFQRPSLVDVQGKTLRQNLVSFDQAEKWCVANGYTIRLSGTTQSCDNIQVLKELRALDYHQNHAGTKLITVAQLKAGDRVVYFMNANIPKKFKTVKAIERIRRGVLGVSLDKGFSWFCDKHEPVVILEGGQS